MISRRPLLKLAGAAPLLAAGAPASRRLPSLQQQHGWMAGCNFLPSTAVNPLQMWQAETFDLPTISRELGWAADLGFRSVRVFLHERVWAHDARGFTARIEAFLDELEKHNMAAIVVLFDSVWNPQPKAQQLRAYVSGVVAQFRNDTRVHGWDVWNEPASANKDARVLPLLEEVFTLAQAARPTQPLISGVGNAQGRSKTALRPVKKLMLERSDVIGFQSHESGSRLQQQIEGLRSWGKPLVCTEFMARQEASTFDAGLQICKRNHVSVYSWGFVSGKTQTIYPWHAWKRPYRELPKEWFHDLLQADGTPYDAAQVAYIKRLTRA